EIATAQARLRSEEAQRERARRDEERLQKLFRGGAGTRVEAENAKIALKNADAQVIAAQAQVENLLRGTPQDIRAARGAVEVAMEGEFTPRNLQTADERADQVFAARVGIDPGAEVLRAGMAAVVRVRR